MASVSGISFGGLFSGLDTESIISQLMQIERQPITLLQQKEYKLKYQKADLMEINTSLLAVKKSIKSFADGLIFQNKFTSSNESVVSGSATAAASTGTYSMTVTNLSSQQVYGSAQKASGWTGSVGQFQITVKNGAGPTFTIQTAGQSLTQIRDAINSTPGFSAYGTAQIITNPSNGNQVLTIKSNSNGIDNGFVYADVDAGTMADLGLAQSQAALDANFTINGVALTSSTDTVSDAIYGVTLNLKGTGTGITVQVGVNNDDIVSTVSSFIEKFNAATELMDKYITEDTNKNPKNEEDFKAGVLRADSDLISSKSLLRLKTTGYVDSTLTTYTTLSGIGIESEMSVGSLVSDKIQFDEDKLRTALNANKDEVVDLLEGWAKQLDDHLANETKVSMTSGLAGTYYERIISINNMISEAEDDIDSWEDRIAAKEDQLRNQFAAMEEALQKLQSQSSYLTTQLNSLLKSSSSSSSSNS